MLTFILIIGYVPVILLTAYVVKNNPVKSKVFLDKVEEEAQKTKEAAEKELEKLKK